MVPYTRDFRQILFHAPDSMPLIYYNFVGGKFDSHYLPQQIALPGSGGMEILKIRFSNYKPIYTPTSKQHVYANFNVAVHRQGSENLRRKIFYRRKHRLFAPHRRRTANR